MSVHRLHRIHYEREAKQAQSFDSCSLSSKAWALAYLVVISWLVVGAFAYGVHLLFR